MINRNISVEDVYEVVKNGLVIANYPTDKPYASVLLLLVVRERPIHAVVAQNPLKEECILVTCYEPDPELWDTSFTQKLK